MEPDMNHPTPSFRTSRDVYGHSYHSEEKSFGLVPMLCGAVIGLLIAAMLFWYGAGI